MKILVISNDHIALEFKEKFKQEHEYIFKSSHSFDASFLENMDLVFDFTLDESYEAIENYVNHKDLIVFCSTAKVSLAELMYYQQEVHCHLIGFNGLPTMINREYLEVSCVSKETHTVLKEICGKLKTEYLIVEDRVGMVTPRVICMIINEAFFTLQEGTANRKDIDLGMKLGTNYPYGPFEWCDKIGIKHVYEVLETVYEDTKDERYKICPLLKKEYLLTT